MGEGGQGLRRHRGVSEEQNADGMRYSPAPVQTMPPEITGPRLSLQPC